MTEVINHVNKTSSTKFKQIPDKEELFKQQNGKRYKTFSISTG